MTVTREEFNTLSNKVDKIHEQVIILKGDVAHIPDKVAVEIYDKLYGDNGVGLQSNSNSTATKLMWGILLCLIGLIVKAEM